MNAGITFLRGWRGREPGQHDTAIDHGVAHELVRRGIARWQEQREQPELPPVPTVAEDRPKRKK